MLDRFLALPMQEPLLAADLDREEIGLFEGLHEILLVLELLHITDLAVKGGADSRCHCHSTSILVQLNFAHCRSHNAHGAVDPVQGESGCNKLATHPEIVHVPKSRRAHDSHAALEADLLDFKWHESTLLYLS